MFSLREVVVSRELPIVPDSSATVFDCHVLITGPDGEGMLHGVVSNLPIITGSAPDERTLLRRIVDDFKKEVSQRVNAGEEIPWQEKGKPGEGQQQRWVPVHL